MTKFLDLNQIRQSWERRYGARTARRMLSGDPGGFAYDSASGLGSPSRRTGRDQEGDERLEAIKTYIRNRLSPEDFDRLEQTLAALSGESEGEGEGEGEGEERGSAMRRYRHTVAEGKDEPSAFSGRPRPGGESDPEGKRREGEDRGRHYASDSAGSSYFDSFPANAAVEVR
ncbi:MAG TPA: hypothetical protein VFE63_09990 [Roseiarcus sp.]|jgi:hypothetical protein|nr:hypothetical protein [Roseiarcus sp.]